MGQCGERRRKREHSELKHDPVQRILLRHGNRLLLYYDPEICRFVNADDSDILWEDQGHLNEHNLYMY